MDLFEIRNDTAFPSVHALLIDPFKYIWENDRSEGKREAIKIFTYVELVCSPKKSNPFFGYDEKVRVQKVKERVWKDDLPKDPSDIIQAVLVYKELLENASPTYGLFMAASKAADTLKANLNSINLDERTRAGTAVTKPADVTRALKEVPDVMRSIETMRDKVNSELIEESKTRKDRKIGQYEE